MGIQDWSNGEGEWRRRGLRQGVGGNERDGEHTFFFPRIYAEISAFGKIAVFFRVFHFSEKTRKKIGPVGPIFFEVFLEISLQKIINFDHNQ